MESSTRRVRVLYTESNVDGTIGGSHYCLLHLVEHLDRARFEPVVLFFEDHALVPSFRAAADTRVEPPPPPSQWGRGQQPWAPVLALARRAANLVRFGGRVRANMAFLRRNGIRLVHLNNSITRTQDWMWAAILAGVPYVVHERGLNNRSTAIDRAVARRAALIVPMSRWIMDHMVERGVPSERIRVMYDGLDPASVAPARSEQELRSLYDVRPGQPVVGIVGNIRRWKGQETVVRAMARVVGHHPDAVCFLVGAATAADQPYFEHLQQIAAEAGITANLRFTGYQQDPASLVRMMQIVIHASVEPEPFGMVVLEAMAQRKPVVGSRAGGVVEMVVEGETGFTFPPGDAETLAARVNDLLADPERARRMGEAGYERLMESFTMTRYMEQVHEAYDSILSDRPLAPSAAAPASGHAQ